MKKPDEMTKDELVAEINNLRSRKKYGLVWEDKPEDVVEQCKKELPVLEEVEKRAIIKSDGPTNLLIEGDNYHALSVLNYTHSGKIDVIYIDPPYNTGARDWKYNNDYVDSEDAYRHSKWLSFMNNRLKPAISLLNEHGVLIVAIDDYELATLGLLLKELMPNYIQDLIIIEHHPQGAGSNTVSRTHEYAYIMTPLGLGFPNREVRHEKQSWSLRRSGQGENNWRINRPNQFFAVLVDEDKNKVVGVDKILSRDEKYPKSKTEDGYQRIYPIDGKGKERVWRYNRESMLKLIKKNKIEYTKRGALVVNKDVVSSSPVFSIWKGSRYNAGTNGSTLLTKIFGDSNKFPYPKSIFNTLDLLNLFVGHKKAATVLDYFAGSGTTGHAVLELNRKDGGNRQFILCTNNESNIAEEVTYERLKKVINGYEDVEGIPAKIRYFKTAFVRKSKVSDDTRKQLVTKATDMICVKEGTYDKKYDNKQFKIYEDAEHVAGILFDLDAIEDFKHRISKQNKHAHLYVFSLSNDTYDEDFDDLTVGHQLIPIPESILEVYKKVFGKK